MRKGHWLVIGMVAGALVLSACSTTKKKGPGVDDQVFSQEEGRTGRMAGDTSIEIGSPEWLKLRKQAERNKCEMIAAVGGVQQHIFFEFDKSDVPDESLEGIHAQSQYLLSHAGTKVRVEGNADDRGSREYNVALGMRRANTVVAILKEDGVPARQIEALSYGAEKPMTKGDEESSYRCNRRVDIVFLK
ncbi:MAG: OmpA family protein [Gammaproteobacteria bacterium]|nr:OmpA family protein [Gammaproteobacteria bacterium]